MDMNRILAKIEHFQKPLGLSDRALSIRATGSADLIRNWRRAAALGKPAAANTKSLTDIAAALNVSLEAIVGQDPVLSPEEAEMLAMYRQLTPADVETANGLLRVLVERSANRETVGETAEKGDE